MVCETGIPPAVVVYVADALILSVDFPLRDSYTVTVTVKVCVEPEKSAVKDCEEETAPFTVHVSVPLPEGKV